MPVVPFMEVAKLLAAWLSDKEPKEGVSRGFLLWIRENVTVHKFCMPWAWSTPRKILKISEDA